MEAAVEAAKSAYRTWSKTSILTRQQVMFRYQHIIRNNMVNYLRYFLHHYITIYHCLLQLQKEIAKNITLEQGKTLVDAEGDVLRGLRKN
jgi:malonate-semialdehyde dehydrogenase (acetylating) / methylmalonate-semialdehyde dehydrogenase